jgi:hypothetical protein
MIHLQLPRVMVPEWWPSLLQYPGELSGILEVNVPGVVDESITDIVSHPDIEIPMVVVLQIGPLISSAIVHVNPIIPFCAAARKEVQLVPASYESDFLVDLSVMTFVACYPVFLPTGV